MRNTKFNHFINELYTKIFRAWIFTFLLIVNTNSVWASFNWDSFNTLLNRCSGALGLHSDQKLEMEQLTLYLGQVDTHRAVMPTVTALGINSNGQLIFEKLPDTQWNSRAFSTSGGITPQGDIRRPMRIFGVELSHFLGFRIFPTKEGKIQILVPGADLLAKKIAQINTELIALNYEPIRYLPVSSGFLSPEEMLNLSIANDGDYLLQFPYADKDLALSAHEVSYHLYAMLYNTEILLRTRALVLMTLHLVNLIREKSRELGEHLTEKLIHSLMDNRSKELDIGTADYFILISSYFAKKAVGVSKFRSALDEIGRDSYRTHSHTRPLDIMAHFSQTPAERVLYELDFLFPLLGTRAVQPDPRYPYQMPRVNAPGVTSYTSPNQYGTIAEIVRQFKAKFLATSESEFSRKSHLDFAADYGYGLDQRLREILLAVKRIKPQKN